MCFPVTRCVCSCNAAGVWLGGSHQAQQVGKIMGWEGTWVISNTSLNANGNEPEATGSQRGQQELTAWHCWEGQHGCVLRWQAGPLKGGELSLPWT